MSSGSGRFQREESRPMSNIAVRLPSSLFRAVPPDLVSRTVAYCSSAVEEAHEDRAVTGQRSIARTTARPPDIPGRPVACRSGHARRPAYSLRGDARSGRSAPHCRRSAAVEGEPAACARFRANLSWVHGDCDRPLTLESAVRKSACPRLWDSRGRVRRRRCRSRSRSMRLRRRCPVRLYPCFSEGWILRRARREKPRPR